MRVKELTNAVGVPLNTANVSFGFFAGTTNKPFSGPYFNWTFSPYYKGRYETPVRSFGGLNNEHWAHSAHSVPILGYFRFTRKGKHFTGELKESASGDWKTIFEETTDLPDLLYIGPYLNQVPTRNVEMFYRVEFDEITIEII